MTDDTQSTDDANIISGADNANPSMDEPTGETTPAAEAQTTTVDANPQPSANAESPSSLAADTRSTQSTQTTANPAAPAQKPTTGTPQPTLDYRKQYEAMLPAYTKAQKEMKAYRELPPIDQLKQQLARYNEIEQQQRQQAEQQKLKPFHPRHPEYQSTKQAIARVNAYRSAARAIPQNLPPEQRQEIARNMASEMGVTQEDAQHAKDWEGHQRSVQERMAEDPEGFFEEIAARVSRQVVNEFEQFQGLRQQTQEFLTQNRDLVKNHAGEIDWAMNHPARREVGIEFARLKAENEQLRAKVPQVLESEETAEAQKALTKQRNTVRRDGASTAIQKDPVAEAEKQGLSDAELADHLIRSRRRNAAATH
jgi:hypothetical protein